MRISGLVVGAMAVVWGSCLCADETFEYTSGGCLLTPGIRSSVVVYGEGWENSISSGSAYRPPEDDCLVRWSAKDSKGLLSVCGEVRATESTNGIDVAAWVMSQADARPECVAYSFGLEAAHFAGWSWRAETSTGPRSGHLPVTQKKMILFSECATSFSLVSPDGTRGYRWSFPSLRPIHFQDSRRWGTEFALRIGSQPKTFAKGTRIDLAFSLSATGNDGKPCVTRLKRDRACVIKAGADWIPVDYRKTILPGSALDFSAVGALDAPAGKYGWVKNRGGDFVFERCPDVKRRFYGVNLCFSANAPTKSIADELVERLVRSGYNTIRLHHYERAICRSRQKAGWGLDPVAMDRFDYLVAKGIEKGLYFTTDVYVSRDVLWEDIGLPERGKGGRIDMQLYKALVAVHDGAFEDWKRFAKELFEHVNPYTGRAYKDEPGLPLVSLVNEGQLTMGWNRGLKDNPIIKAAYRKWLAERRAADPAFRPEAPETVDGLSYWGPNGNVMAAFMADVERRSAARMKAALREIGVKALITNANCGPHPATMAAVRRDVYDYTDDHFYVDHPHFLEKSWRLPSRCPNVNPVVSGVSELVNCAYTRYAGQPMCITEWNFSGPGRYRGVGGILTGAFAALQDWSGVWRFAYAHSEELLSSENSGRPGYFDVASDVLSLMSDKASLCLFLRGDLASAAASEVVELRPEAIVAAKGKGFDCVPAKDADRAWSRRVAVATPQDAAAPHVAPTPCAFRLDRARGSFIINTPRTSGGFAESGVLDCGALSFELVDTPATVWASSVDPAAGNIAAAKRLVVFHLTDVQADGNVYADQKRQILLKWGSAPSIMRAGSARVSLALSEPTRYKVWSIGTDGARRESIPVQVKNGRLCFTASVKGASTARFAYEVAIE